MWKCPKCNKSFKRVDQQHFCGKAENIDEYIESQEEEVKPYLKEIRNIIHKAILDAEERISWSMPTFRKGRNIIHFAAFSHHLGLYPGGEATEVFAEWLADYDCSKGSIRLPYKKPLTAELISDIAKWCCSQYAKQE